MNNDTFNGAATRNTVNVLWAGKEPLKLPPAVIALGMGAFKPGINVGVPTTVFHALGGYGEMLALIASGELSTVCVSHRFEDEKIIGVKHCISCGHTAETAAAVASV